MLLKLSEREEAVLDAFEGDEYTNTAVEVEPLVRAPLPARAAARALRASAARA